MSGYVERMSLAVLVVTALSIAVSGSVTSVYAQLKITGCLTKKGKLKQAEFGENPRKACKSSERLLMLPITVKTDELMKGVSALQNKDQELMDKDGQLMEKDTQLMDGVRDLEAKDQELMAEVNARQEQIDDILAGLENPETFPGDGYPSPDQFGVSGHGPLLSYTDNGDLTAKDNNTLFVWELKLADDGSDGGNCTDIIQANRSVHCVNNVYNWSTNELEANGPLFTVFLDTLNNKCDGDEATQCTSNADCTGIGNGLCGHAGHRDWEIPNVRKLFSLADYSEKNPALDPAFPGPTSSIRGYYSSTMRAMLPDFVWAVFFSSQGFGGLVPKTLNGQAARAVRRAPELAP